MLLGPGAARFALPEAGVLAASEAQLRAACENGATDSATMEPLEEALAAGVPLALTRSVGGSVATAHLAASLAAWALRSKVDGAGREYGEPNGCDPVSRLPLSAVQVEAVARFARSGGAVASPMAGRAEVEQRLCACHGARHTCLANQARSGLVRAGSARRGL